MAAANEGPASAGPENTPNRNAGRSLADGPPTVAVPTLDLILAFMKAQRLYAEACDQAGEQPPRRGECWAEFERLADHLDDAGVPPPPPWTGWR
jgi:hypothetical protein